MHSAHEFLQALTIVLGVAAVVTVLFQRLRQPVVLGYIIAGLIIGPHVPIPLVADRAIVQTLSELGVILLMFSLGLEFSLRKLLRVGPRAGITAVVESSIMTWLGFLAGRAFGRTTLESLFTGAIVAISSTTIIAKAFDEQGVKGSLRELVVGVLVVEDLIAILLMATLTALASGAGLSAGALAVTLGRLLAFLVGLVVVGLFVVPRAMRAVVRLGRPETTLISSIGVCFAISLLAQAAGYSVALGAFIAGSLVAESGEEQTIEHLLLPVRDLFAAVFFVSVGMMIDPALIARHWAAVAVLTAVVIAGKVLSVTLGAFLTGGGVRASVQSGMSLAQIGEFSFIIAGLGLALGATRDFLYPVAVSVAALTTFTTPWLIRASGRVAEAVDRRLPRALQTFAALYGTWLEGLRRAPSQTTQGAQARRLVRLLLVNAVILAAIIIGSAVAIDRAVEVLRARVQVHPGALRWLVVGATVLVSIPFGAGVVRVARRLGVMLAEAAFPAARAGRVDLAAAPRRALVVALQLTIVLLVGAPLVALTQPFLPAAAAAAVLAGLLLVLAAGFWRSATNLEGHVRAGAQVVAEALAAQAQSGTRASAAATLVVPPASEVLRSGDVVAVTGTPEALAAARVLLTGQMA
ncbi:MAG TPA: cation:proton antiporter [Polyangia bacterium]|jgi:CPA2 family monovalent cation:H+ antiporter-2